jgi:hypothetical protein
MIDIRDSNKSNLYRGVVMVMRMEKVGQNDRHKEYKEF